MLSLCSPHFISLNCLYLHCWIQIAIETDHTLDYRNSLNHRKCRQPHTCLKTLIQVILLIFLDSLFLFLFLCLSISPYLSTFISIFGPLSLAPFDVIFTSKLVYECLFLLLDVRSPYLPLDYSYRPLHFILYCPLCHFPLYYYLWIISPTS